MLIICQKGPCSSCLPTFSGEETHWRRRWVNYFQGAEEQSRLGRTIMFTCLYEMFPRLAFVTTSSLETAVFRDLWKPAFIPFPCP